MAPTGQARRRRAACSTDRQPSLTFPTARARRQSSTSTGGHDTDDGHGRGFSAIMPSFADALASEQIDAVIRYMRILCRSDRYPRGELNCLVGS